MTPLDAVAAAIRERLLAGRPAPLPGLGTLVRQHVASRIQERADGTRMLMPPGETIGLASEPSPDHESLGVAFGRFRGQEGAEAIRAYRDAMDQIEARLSATGEVRLPGVGLLRRTSGGVILGVEADLLAAVNRTYEGLAPVGAAPSPPSTPERSPEPEPPPSATPPDVEVTVIGSASHDPFGDESDPLLPADPAEASPSAASATERPSPAQERTEANAPLRDLSSGPGSPPYAPPTFAASAPDLPETPEPAAPPHLGGAPETPAHLDTEPAASPEADPDSFAYVDAESADGDREMTETEFAPQQPHVPEAQGADDNAEQVSETEAPPAQAQPSTDFPLPTDAEFVDEDTLDADLDELAVPFGAGPPLRDLLSPTPDHRDNDDEPTWTASTPELEAANDPVADVAHEETEVSIEEASYQDLDPEPQADPIIERVGPSAALDALLADSEREDNATLPAEPRAADSVADLDRDADSAVIVPVEGSASQVAAPPGERFPWWLVALAVLLALALLLAWLWPRLATQTARATVPTEQPLTGSARIAPTRAQPDGSVPTQLEVGAVDFGAPEIEASQPVTPPIETASQASGGGTARGNDPLPARPGLGQAPAAGYAISPPRLAGLVAADVRAFSSPDPVDADADAWTLVVLSTPSRDDARALSARYRSAGYRTGVVAAANDRAMHRVAVGQFLDRAQARRLHDRLPPQAPADAWPLDLRTL